MEMKKSIKRWKLFYDLVALSERFINIGIGSDRGLMRLLQPCPGTGAKAGAPYRQGGLY